MDEKKKPNLFLRALAFLVTLALVLGAVFLVVNWRSLNFDSIRRWFAYRSLEKNEYGQVDSFPYSGGSKSSFAQLGDDLLVASSNGVRLYSPSGGVYIEQSCSLSHPVVDAAGTTGLVYDAGGRDLFVFRDRQLVYTDSTDADHALLSASLSAQGRLSVVTQASGLKGAVTVYNAAFGPLLDVNISSRFITDSLLSPDGSTLVLATAGQTGGVYDSQLAFYNVTRPAGDNQPDAVCSLGGDVILAMEWSGQELRVLGEKTLSFVSPDGTLLGSYSFDGLRLKGFSLDGDEFCSLLLGRYRAGSSAELVMVDLSGQAAVSLSLDTQVLSMSAAGRYLSLLTSDGLTIYTDELETYHHLDATQGSERVLQRPDGSVTLIAGESARLYLPS